MRKEKIKQVERKIRLLKLRRNLASVPKRKPVVKPTENVVDKVLSIVREAKVRVPKTDLSPLESRITALENAPPVEIPVVEFPEIEIPDIDGPIADLERRINSKLAHLGGGNMNRSILVGGDKDTLSKFTDINLKAGAGTTITYLANQTTGYTDITITATGSGSGITRSVNVISIDTAAGDTASIDYVYVVSGTTTLTLPTAINNTNLYTVKNVGVGTATIATTGGETIDGSANLVLPLQFTSVDLISDGIGWSIT